MCMGERTQGRDVERKKEQQRGETCKEQRKKNEEGKKREDGKPVTENCE